MEYFKKFVEGFYGDRERLNKVKVNEFVEKVNENLKEYDKTTMENSSVLHIKLKNNIERTISEMGIGCLITVSTWEIRYKQEYINISELFTYNDSDIKWHERSRCGKNRVLNARIEVSEKIGMTITNETTLADLIYDGISNKITENILKCAESNASLQQKIEQNNKDAGDLVELRAELIEKAGA